MLLLVPHLAIASSLQYSIDEKENSKCRHVYFYFFIFVMNILWWVLRCIIGGYCTPLMIGRSIWLCFRLAFFFFCWRSLATAPPTFEQKRPLPGTQTDTDVPRFLIIIFSKIYYDDQNGQSPARGS